MQRGGEPRLPETPCPHLSKFLRIALLIGAILQICTDEYQASRGQDLDGKKTPQAGLSAYLGARFALMEAPAKFVLECRSMMVDCGFQRVVQIQREGVENAD